MGRIEKIKMRDFKSFKRAVIPVVDGFTTIVGPNGSGKSNFLDAVLFVMGASSMKLLRAGRLTDLVRTGAKKDTAEVTVELRNGTDKYSISRSIDKKGTSIFRFNDKRVPRTQIVEILNSFNIPQEGHNVIMQGDVTSIIKMTPKQRREVIDDVSGIAEYNQKKDKAIKELDKVEEKIKEANIILYERKGYLGELRKERNEALRYNRFDEEKKDLRATIASKECEKLTKSYEELVEKTTSAKKELEDLNDKLSRTSASLKEKETGLAGLNNEIISKGEDEQITIHKEIEQSKGSIRVIDEKINSRKTAISSSKNALQNNKKALKELSGRFDEKQKALKKLEEEDKISKQRVEEKQKDVDDFMDNLKEKNIFLGDVTARLEELNSQISEAKEGFYACRSQVDNMREKISINKLGLTARDEEVSYTGKRTDEIKASHEEMDKSLAINKRALKGVQLEIEKLVSVEEEIKKELSQCESILDKARERYHSLQSKITTIKHMSGNTASDYVIKAKQELSGIVGRVEDLCSFDSKHSSAIQSAAGNRLHFIVTETADAATNAVKWLKKKQLGRTTFIPLDVIRSISVDDQTKKALKNKDALGLAIDLVKFDKKLQKAFEYVLGNTIIVRDLATAKEIGFGTARMATLDGDLAEPIGTITGGFKHGSMTVQEMKDVDELKEKIKQLEKKKEQQTRRLEETRSTVSELRTKAAKQELDNKELEVQLRETGNRLGEYETGVKQVEDRNKKAKKEIEELEAGIKEGESQLKEFQTKIESIETEKEKTREKMDSPEARVVSERMADMQKKLEAIKDQRAEIVMQINTCKGEVGGLIAEKEKDLKKSSAELEERILLFEKEITGLEENSKKEDSLLKELIIQEKRISGSIKGLIEKRENLEKEIRELAEERGMSVRKKEVKQHHFNEANIEKARVETKLIDSKQELETLGEPTRDYSEISIDKMKERIEQLTIRMARLEPINLKSVEMYDKYMEELDGMKEKAKILENEKQAIIYLMDEIEKKRIDVFKNAFNDIRIHFNEVYKQFFPEDEERTYANMKLENKEDPFEGGIILEARPAGKPIKRIESMSGGEKTLTALAFLFAIQTFKPSPFYVLDEADPALDAVNSRRLCDMLKKRSKDCQFIVITHNRPLIHSSDQIIGIHMDKKKSTSFVEVNLKALEEAGKLTEDIIGTPEKPAIAK